MVAYKGFPPFIIIKADVLKNVYCNYLFSVHSNEELAVGCFLTSQWELQPVQFSVAQEAHFLD